MKINRNSWHYKFMRLWTQTDPTTSCQYFFRFFMYMFGSIVFGTMIGMMLIFFPAWGIHIHMLPGGTWTDIAAGFFCYIIAIGFWTIVVLLYLLDNFAKSSVEGRGCSKIEYI